LPLARRDREALPGSGRTHLVGHAPRTALDPPGHDCGTADDERPDFADPQELRARGHSPRDLPGPADPFGDHEAAEDLDANRVTIVTHRPRNPSECQHCGSETVEVGLGVRPSKRWSSAT